jgi:hypothetical protein
MSIEYTYEITKVDEAARCMEVVYSSEGHQTMHIGARLPFEGESLESIIKAFAPVPLWIELATPVVTPPVGLTGVLSNDQTEVPAADKTAIEPIFPTVASGAIDTTSFE